MIVITNKYQEYINICSYARWARAVRELVFVEAKEGPIAKQDTSSELKDKIVKWLKLLDSPFLLYGFALTRHKKMFPCTCVLSTNVVKVGEGPAQEVGRRGAGHLIKKLRETEQPSEAKRPNVPCSSQPFGSRAERENRGFDAVVGK